MSDYDNANIYYLSGTGNSYRVATWSGKELKGTTIGRKSSRPGKSNPKYRA